MILTKTPMRVSLFGGGTDLPEYYSRNGGAVLSFTINKYVYVMVNDRFESSFRCSYSEYEETASIEEIKHPIIRNVLQTFAGVPPLEIVSIADVPGKGTGLGSSSAFAVGLLNAIHAKNKNNVRYSKNDLAEQAYKIERELCAQAVGKQDQYAASFGGLNFFEFSTENEVKVNSLDHLTGNLLQFLQSVQIFYTGFTRSASNLLQSQAKLSQSGANIWALDKVKSQAYTAYEYLEKGNTMALGQLLDEAWEAKKNLHQKVSNANIDMMYREAKSAGAVGGKLLGAGGGGFLLLSSPPERHGQIAKALVGYRSMEIDLARGGSTVIESL